jgi:hypothetical protein
MDDAVKTYAAIVSGPPKNPSMLEVWVRASLKAAYYGRLQQRGVLIRRKHVERANLLNGFGVALDEDPHYQKAITANDLRTFETVVREKALTTRAVMMRDADEMSPSATCRRLGERRWRHPNLTTRSVRTRLWAGTDPPWSAVFHLETAAKLLRLLGVFWSFFPNAR